MQEFDAWDTVFVVIAHGTTLLDEEVGMLLFPHATLQNWKEQALAAKEQWGFLKDLEGAVSKSNM